MIYWGWFVFAIFASSTASLFIVAILAAKRIAEKDHKIWQLEKKLDDLMRKEM